jgi:hypothetical protein
MGGSKALVVFVNVVYSMSLLEEVFPVLHTCSWSMQAYCLHNDHVRQNRVNQLCRQTDSQVSEKVGYKPPSTKVKLVMQLCQAS